MRISEAAIKLADAANDLVPDRPWSEVRGVGNHLRHAYDRVDPDIIWEIIVGDLPGLKKGCLEAIDRLREASG